MPMPPPTAARRRCCLPNSRDRQDRHRFGHITAHGVSPTGTDSFLPFSRPETGLRPGPGLVAEPQRRALQARCAHHVHASHRLMLDEGPGSGARA